MAKLKTIWRKTTETRDNALLHEGNDPSDVDTNYLFTGELVQENGFKILLEENTTGTERRPAKWTDNN